MSTSDEITPLLSLENDEEETREKELFEYVEPNVVMAPTCEAEYLDIHKEDSKDSKISINQGSLFTDTNERSETNLNHTIVDIENPNISQNVQRQLPDGKKYHMFVSFCSEDEYLVKPIVRKLEEEGLRCMLDGRDFIGGKSIIENIIDALKNSHKILMMMTPNFVKSRPCMYEQQQAVHIFNWTEKRSNFSIPVLLRPCDIPASLKNLTYIDAEKAENDSCLIKKIIESYDLNETVEDFMPDNPFQEVRLQLRQLPIEVSKYINGTVVTNVNASKKFNGIRGSGWQFKELAESQRLELRKAEIQEAESVYEEIREKLNSSVYMKIYGIFTCGTRCSVSYIWFTLLFSFWAVLSIATIEKFEKETDFESVATIKIIYVILVSCIHPIASCYVNLQLTNSFLLTLYKHGIRTCLDGNFLILLENKRPVNLVFIRYDANPCLEYIKGRFKILHPMDSESEISVRAEKVLKNSLHEHLYKRSFIWKQLPETDERRHEIPMSLNRRCLCQLARGEIEDISAMP